LATTRAGYKETHFDDDAEIDIEIEIIASKNLPNATIGMIITNQEGQPVLHVASNLKDKSFKIKKGINKIRYSIPSNLLLHGQYSITIAGVEPNLHTYFRLVDAICFILLSKNEEINRYAKEVWKGVLNPKLGTWYYLK
jgi:hypothetical protein